MQIIVISKESDASEGSNLVEPEGDEVQHGGELAEHNGLAAGVALQYTHNPWSLYGQMLMLSLCFSLSVNLTPNSAGMVLWRYKLNHTVNTP